MIKKLRHKISLLQNNKGFLKYFENTSWLFVERIIRMFIGIFVGIWVARYLGPKEFGLLSYAQSFVGLFTIFATLGLDSIVVRELVKDGTNKNLIIGTAFCLKLMGAVITLAVLGTAVNFTSNDSSTNILIFIIGSATIFQSFNVIDFYFQSIVLSRYVVFTNFISLAVSSIVKIFFILYEAPLIAFAYVVVFDSLILSLGLIYFFVRHSTNTIKYLQFNKLCAIDLLKNSLPLILSGGLLMIQAYIDQVMINEFLGSEEVGYYSVAIKLIAFFGFMPMILKSSFFPAIQNAKNNSEEIYKERLINFYRLNFLAFLLFAIPIFIFAEVIVVTLFGSEYAPAGIILALSAGRLLFANIGVARSAYMLTENMMTYSMLTMLIGTAINIMLNLYFIPIWGSLGAIMATLISLFITVFFIDIFYPKARKNLKWTLEGIFSIHKIYLN